MGQQVSSYVLRLGINQAWQSNYFPPKKEQVNWLRQDKLIRDYFYARFPGITQIRIERTEAELVIFVHSTNVSSIASKSNDNSDIILAKIAEIMNDKKIITKLHLVTERNSAQAIANDLAQQIESRVSCHLALRSVLTKLSWDVKGFYAYLTGRLNGVEMARSKTVKQGSMPSSKLDAFIEEAATEANTTYGKIGITVKIHREREKK